MGRRKGWRPCTLARLPVRGKARIVTDRMEILPWRREGSWRKRSCTRRRVHAWMRMHRGISRETAEGMLLLRLLVRRTLQLKLPFPAHSAEEGRLRRLKLGFDATAVGRGRRSRRGGGAASGHGRRLRGWPGDSRWHPPGGCTSRARPADAYRPIRICQHLRRRSANLLKLLLLLE